MPLGQREYERTIDGRLLTICVDCGDYPEIIIEGATDEDGNEVALTRAQEYALYEELSIDIAGDLADAAMDYYDDR